MLNYYMTPAGAVSELDNSTAKEQKIQSYRKSRKLKFNCIKAACSELVIYSSKVSGAEILRADV